VQEALARAWERSERGERIESLGAWVTTVALNLGRSRWRRAMAERRARDRIGSPEAPPAPDDAVDIERALAGLSRRQREAVVLRYYLGEDVAGVARILGVSEGTVKTTLHRARRALAAALGEREDDHVGS
jgi:RNA polymerase sigma-70 factor, ECF subfamily